MVRAASAMLEVKRLRKVYEDSSRTVEAIRDVSFSVGQGELVCIVGPSGAGKTTLLEVRRRTAGAVVGRNHPRRPDGGRAAARHGGRVSGIRPQPVSVDDRARQRGAAAQAQEDRRGPSRGTGARCAGGRRSQGRRERLSVATLRRHAAARRHCPRRRLRAACAAHGRAVRRRRCADARRSRRPDPRVVAAGCGSPCCSSPTISTNRFISASVCW